MSTQGLKELSDWHHEKVSDVDHLKDIFFFLKKTAIVDNFTAK